MKQVIVIHGGDSFARYEEYLNYLKTRELTVEKFLPRKEWKTTLDTELGTGFQVLMPEMPNKTNAKFEEWKIWFERMLPFLNDEVILIGHSLGGMFLVRYLTQNDFPKKIAQLHLVAPPHNQTDDVAEFLLPDDISAVAKQTNNIFFYFSKDDPLVPFSEMDYFKNQLPDAEYIAFEDRGHFKQQTFPELIKKIHSI